jgi:hypothetical protein
MQLGSKVISNLLARPRLQSFQTDYAAGALSLTEAGATGAAGAGGTTVVVLIVPASTVVPQELQPAAGTET